MPTHEQRSAQQTQQGSSSSTGTSSTGSNSAAIEQLQGQGPELPEQNLGNVESGTAFANMAGGLLDAVAPDEGSALTFKLSGSIPLYKTPGVTVSFKPSLNMGVARKKGKMEATMQLAAAIEVSAEVDAWLVDLEAALKASFSGTLKIVGDSGAEVFDEFLLSLRYIIEAACESVSMPDRIKSTIVTGIMSDEAMQETIEGMDGSDKVQLDLDAGLNASASAGVVGASASASVRHSMTLQNDGNDNLTAGSNTSTTVAGTVNVGPFKAERKIKDGVPVDTLSASHDLSILGQPVSASLKMQFKNEQLHKVQLTGSASKEITWDDLCDMMTTDGSWLNTLKNTLVNGVTQLNQQIDNPILNNIAGRIGSSPTDIADASISDLGSEVTESASSVDFDAKAQIKATADVSWQRGRGFLFAVTLATNNTTSVGFGGNQLEITQNDRLLYLTVGNDGLQMDFS